MTRYSSFSLVLVVAICFALILACDSYSSLKGKVIDETGTPLPDALVIVEVDYRGPRKEIKTMDDGTFEFFDNVHPFGSKIEVTISKDGYQTLKQNYHSSDLPMPKVNEKEPDPRAFVLIRSNQ